MSGELDFDTGIMKIAGAINAAKGARSGGSFLSPGDVSSLRRMNTSVPVGAFWRLMSTYISDADRGGDEMERRWALVCQGMALMAPTVHDSARTPGGALAATGFSSEDRPIRINRLLRATDDAFDDLFLSACRFLGSKAQAIDWRSFSRLALFRDERQRKQLARDFYSSKTAAITSAAA